MDSTRRARLEGVILEELTLAIRREIKDPRVDQATISRVELTEDGRQATVFVSAFSAVGQEDSDATIDRCVEGLQSASGFLRRKLGPALQLRYLPELLFKSDRGIMNSLRVQELLKQLEAEKKNRSESGGGSDGT